MAVGTVYSIFVYGLCIITMDLPVDIGPGQGMTFEAVFVLVPDIGVHGSIPASEIIAENIDETLGLSLEISQNPVIGMAFITLVVIDP